MLKFRAKELKERIDLLVEAGVEVIRIEKGFGRRCFIDGFSPYVPENDLYEPIMEIMEEE